MILPAAALPRRLPKFSAVIWLGIIFVDGRLEGAPKNTVRAIIAHEFGHVACGHALVALLIVAAAIATMILPVAASTLAALLMLAIYIALVAGLIWLQRPRREFEADAFGAQLVGRSEIADALAWTAHWSGRGWTPPLLRRRAKLMCRPT